MEFKSNSFVGEGVFILNGRKIIIKEKTFISEGCFLDGRKFQIEIGKNSIFLDDKYDYGDLIFLDQSKVFPANLSESSAFRTEIQKSYKFMETYGSLGSIKKLMSNVEK